MKKKPEMENTPAHIIDKIKSIMKYKGLTQQKLADAITEIEDRPKPYDRKNISNILSGEYSLSIKRLISIAKILEVPAVYLWVEGVMDPLDLKIIAHLLTMNDDQKMQILDFIIRLGIPREEIEKRSGSVLDSFAKFADIVSDEEEDGDEIDDDDDEPVTH